MDGVQNSMSQQRSANHSSRLEIGSGPTLQGLKEIFITKDIVDLGLGKILPTGELKPQKPRTELH